MHEKSKSALKITINGEKLGIITEITPQGQTITPKAPTPPIVTTPKTPTTPIVTTPKTPTTPIVTTPKTPTTPTITTIRHNGSSPTGTTITPGTPSTTPGRPTVTVTPTVRLF